ncbi:conserved hypothetical protein [Halomonas sp. 59]|nr:hypothetical protein HALOI3_20068 [Halomonas sp. I3]CAD5274062.1 conserved hypothetical protein [Halomonas sp. 113]CAD5275707.1 conserved hypothetical protein [Halomonas sp. 59]CAD5277927.1 conserved hypothetical protein [Halomonas sp. 156]VXB94504.1 conserved hypothetical protein [Halomonas titanicae]
MHSIYALPSYRRLLGAFFFKPKEQTNIASQEAGTWLMLRNPWLYKSYTKRILRPKVKSVECFNIGYRH